MARDLPDLIHSSRSSSAFAALGNLKEKETHRDQEVSHLAHLLEPATPWTWLAAMLQLTPQRGAEWIRRLHHQTVSRWRVYEPVGGEGLEVLDDVESRGPQHQEALAHHLVQARLQRDPALTPDWGEVLPTTKNPRSPT